MICAYCNHPLTRHCQGGVTHSDHKEDARMVPLAWRKGESVCVGRHCNEPLCCCVEFREAM